MPMMIERRPLTSTWATDVDAVVEALNLISYRFPDGGMRDERSTVVFTEFADDGRLHVTIVRPTECWTVAPWLLTRAPDGFRYSHSFADASVLEIANAIRAQLAARPLAAGWDV